MNIKHSFLLFQPEYQRQKKPAYLRRQDKESEYQAQPDSASNSLLN